MNKKILIKIPLPKWKWWQYGLFFVLIIFAFCLDTETASNIMEALFMAMSDYTFRE